MIFWIFFIFLNFKGKIIILLCDKYFFWQFIRLSMSKRYANAYNTDKLIVINNDTGKN
jgi:hypothetical protein